MQREIGCWLMVLDVNENILNFLSKFREMNADFEISPLTSALFSQVLDELSIR